MSTLATGAALTPETFADFVARLQHDVEGEGVKHHYTADAIFIVQARVEVAGIDRDYTDKLLVFVDESTWYSPQEYWDDLDEHGRESLDRKAVEEEGSSFLGLDVPSQWDILDDLPDHTVTGWDERWEYVSAHMTKDAADAFVKRKGHDYRKGLRVYVESQCYSWEYNAIINALMRGDLVLKGQQA